MHLTALTTNDSKFFAHSANRAGRKHLLRDHLADVGRIAGNIAGKLPWKDEAVLAGLLHDLGKYGDRFQARLRGEERHIDHWSAGAWILLTRFRAIAAALSVQGHHIGLQRYRNGDDLKEIELRRLAVRHPLNLTLSDPDSDRLFQRAASDRLAVTDALPFKMLDARPEHDLAAHMLDVRLLFSTLVDADFLDTEAHFNGDEAGKRYRHPGSVLRAEDAIACLEAHLDRVRDASKASDEVRVLRDDLWDVCQSAAAQPPGLWTLSAPTGSGKTLAMLGFALRHAACNGLRRVVFVIPYLTIIEQTAAQLRRIFEAEFGPEYVLEHHSLAGSGAEQDRHDAEEESSRRRRLLAENWDAPIVVTTSVQFLESLFSNRPSSCRKLHSLMESVILFDEVQTLPPALTLPTLATLARLSIGYRTSIVLATATQPAFDHLDSAVKPYNSVGWQAKEIVPATLNLFARAARTKGHLPKPLEWDELCEELRRHERVLCIVNLKRHARELVERLQKVGDGHGMLHLSTNMCPAHRQEILAEVRRRLDPGAPRRCVLISTQCVEAGVDVDFPVVYRAFGPLESIAQAAGRCNREGRGPRGDVFVFRPPAERGRSGYPSQAYENAASVTEIILAERTGTLLDLNDPELFRAYYHKLYDLAKPQELSHELREAILDMDFVKTAQEYRVIEKDAINVLVPYSKNALLQDRLFEEGLTAAWMRKAQAYTVNLYRPRSDAAVRQWLLPAPLGRRQSRTSVSEDWFVYSNPDHYHPILGLLPPDEAEVWIG